MGFTSSTIINIWSKWAQLCTTKTQEIEGFRRLKYAQKKAERYVPRTGWFSFQILDVVVGFTSGTKMYLVQTNQIRKY